MQAAPPLLPASSSSEVGQAERDDEQEIPAGGTGASVSMAFVDDAQSDISSDGEPENASSSNSASLLRDQDLDLTSVPGLLSYMSMEAATMKALADVLFKIALMLLFAAGLMRTSVPSLLYAAFSVQALYCSRVGLKAIFPSALVVCTAGIAIAMVIIHIVVNQSSAAFSPLLLQVPMHHLPLIRPHVCLLSFHFSCSAPASCRRLRIVASTCISYRTLWPCWLP